jgi:hypothetical protein
VELLILAILLTLFVRARVALHLLFYVVLFITILFIMFLSGFCTLLVVAQLVLASSWIEYPNDGIATMTHYSLPVDFITACGCTAQSTHYPTAALNQMAFGSSTAFGPACGRCFNLSLLNTFLSDPPFFPPTPKSIVVKVTDLCPLSTTGWCNATTSGPNAYVLFSSSTYLYHYKRM